MWDEHVAKLACIYFGRVSTGDNRVVNMVAMRLHTIGAAGRVGESAQASETRRKEERYRR